MSRHAKTIQTIRPGGLAIQRRAVPIMRVGIHPAGSKLSRNVSFTPAEPAKGTPCNKS